MSLDDSPNWLHASLLENDDHPSWDPVSLRMAREQEAREAEAARRSDQELTAFESVEAEEARASYRMRRSAVEIPRVHYP